MDGEWEEGHTVQLSIGFLLPVPSCATGHLGTICPLDGLTVFQDQLALVPIRCHSPGLVTRHCSATAEREREAEAYARDERGPALPPPFCICHCSLMMMADCHVSSTKRYERHHWPF